MLWHAALQTALKLGWTSIRHRARTSMNSQGIITRACFMCVGWKPDTNSLTAQVTRITSAIIHRCLRKEYPTSPAMQQDVPASDLFITQMLSRVSHQRMSFCDMVYIEKEKRNLILLQCCDKLLFPVVISESIRMDVVEGKWKLGVVIVASDTDLGTTSVVVLALPSTVAMVVVPAVWDAPLVETSTVVEVVGRSEKQEQQWNLIKVSTQSKSQMVI